MIEKISARGKKIGKYWQLIRKLSFELRLSFGDHLVTEKPALLTRKRRGFATRLHASRSRLCTARTRSSARRHRPPPAPPPAASNLRNPPFDIMYLLTSLRISDSDSWLMLAITHIHLINIINGRFNVCFPLFSEKTKKVIAITKKSSTTRSAR